MKCIKCLREVTEYANGRRCRDCYNEYMREYMLNRYHRLRLEALEAKGGKCIDCGSSSRLEFDHEDASDKKFSVAKIFTHAKFKILAELEKCVLRCQDCHLQKSLAQGDITTVEHGGGVSGKKNCPCDLCKSKKSEYMKKYKKTS